MDVFSVKRLKENTGNLADDVSKKVDFNIKERDSGPHRFFTGITTAGGLIVLVVMNCRAGLVDFMGEDVLIC